MAGLVVGLLLGAGGSGAGATAAVRETLETRVAEAERLADEATEQLTALEKDVAARTGELDDLAAQVSADQAAVAAAAADVEARVAAVATREADLLAREQALAAAQAAPPPAPAPAPAPAAAPPSGSVYYENCDAARAAGADPVYVGEPGYRAALDRDGDGVGCE